MNKIGFNNFRRYLNFEPLEFGGITFLTGRNNSGKSTLVKALLLIDAYFKSGRPHSFSFGNSVLEDANIVTFGRAKNYSSSADWISFTFQILEFYVEMSVYGVDDQTVGVVDSLLIIDTKNNLNYHFNMGGGEIHISKTNLLKDENEGEQQQLTELEKEILELADTLKTSTLKKSSREYITMVEDLRAVENKRDLLLNKETESDIQYSFTIEVDKNKGLKEIVEFTTLMASIYHDREFTEIQGGAQESKYFADYRAVAQDQKLIEERFSDFYSLIHDWHSIVYLPANPAKQSALFQIRDTNNALAQSIHIYYQLKMQVGEPAYVFIEKWMKEFEIGDSFEIIIHGGEAYEVKIKSGDSIVQLADKGMGSIQAMLLIFRLAVILYQTLDTDDILTIIIEEPELNLHPALQSKLADLFLEIYEKCHHDFVIETHSEYILRRSQVIVAEKEFEITPNHNPFKAYYFPVDPKQSPYSLAYREDGSFDKNFGDGFFDEASSSTLELLKLKRQKKA